MAYMDEATALKHKIEAWMRSPSRFVREVFGAKPDAWQREALDAFPKSQRICIKGCKGPGKAHPVSMMFYTPEGLRRWGDLVAGDRVFAEDGSATVVKAVYTRGILPMFRVTFDDGSSVLCSGDHLWKVRGRTERRHGAWSVLSVKEILDRGVRERNGKWKGRQFEIPRQGIVGFAKTEHYRRVWRGSDLDPYLLGAWLGDGCRRSSRGSWRDAEIDAEIRSRGYEIARHAYGVTIYGIRDELRRLGILDLGSHERFVPEEYRVAIAKHRKELLSGLMDTDGCIGTDGSMEFDSTSKRLADDVVWLARSLGGVAFIRDAVKKGWYPDESGNRVECRNCYRVSITLPFNPFCVEKKKVRWHLPQDRYLTRYIDKIEEVHSEEAMCIEVDHPSGCYLANDFIVTHNSTLLAWLIWNFLVTRPNPKIAATSITSDNLRDGLWSELSKWRNRSPLLSGGFEITKTRVECKGHEENWFASARTWSKSADATQQADTLAGLHEDYMMFVIDEAGGVPDAVLAAAEGGLATGVDTKLIVAGNPTQAEGPIYRACTSERHLWHVVEITGDPDDPRRSNRISMQWAKEQIEKYGADNPWVQVNVFGRFPSAAMNVLLTPEEVSAAMRREAPEQEHVVKRLGVDCARFGDDATVIFPRQGLQAYNAIEMRGARTDEIAARVAEAKRKWGSEEEFVDDTGGYGAGVIDQLIQGGHSPVPVNFSGKADDPRYFNKRSEMWFRMAKWVKEGGCLPEDMELLRDLTVPTYTFQRGKFRVEEKAQIKERLGRSPDRADALAETFFSEDVPSSTPMDLMRRKLSGTEEGHQKLMYEYDPNEWKVGSGTE